MTRLAIRPTQIADVFEIERRPLGDHRGSLTRVFCSEELAVAGWRKPTAQINHTRTNVAGTVRGLHLQLSPASEMKLVLCLAGSIFDVAVDLRRGSPSFLRHHHAVLSPENNRALLIPEGCAHGFQTLTDDVELLYLHSAPHDAAREHGVSAFDGRLAIKWPLPLTEISERDRNQPPLSSDFRGLDL